MFLIINVIPHIPFCLVDPLVLRVFLGGCLHLECIIGNHLSFKKIVVLPLPVIHLISFLKICLIFKSLSNCQEEFLFSMWRKVPCLMHFYLKIRTQKLFGVVIIFHINFSWRAIFISSTRRKPKPPWLVEIHILYKFIRG